MSLKNGKDKICTVCNKEYYVVHSRVEKSKWCSSECWSKRGETKNTNLCLHCGKEFKRYGVSKYCSRVCSHLDMVGSKSPTWIDGKSLERDRARLGTEVREWRIQVYKRDNYTCQKCGYKGKEIQAHHIIEWAKDESQRFNIDNGMTLCIDCHGKIHNRNFRQMKESKAHNKLTRMLKLDPSIKILKNGKPHIQK